MTYAQKKEAAREEAIDWQIGCSEESYSYEDLIGFQAYFSRKAKRYGLIREFRENGII